MSDSEKLAKLITAVAEHRRTVWGTGPVDHPDDDELYQKLDAILAQGKPA